MAREASRAFQQILVMLHQAQNDLRIRTKVFRLKAYLRHLQAQDNLIRESGSWVMPIPVSTTLIRLFKEINEGFPEHNLSFEGHGRADALRSMS